MIGDIIIFGAIWTAIYSLVAVGFSLIFGVGRIMNLAHGAFYMITCYVVYYITTGLGLHMALAVPVAILITVAISFLTYYLLIKPMRGELTQVLIITLALAIFLEQFIIVTAGPEPRYVPSMVQGGIELLGARVTNQQVLAIVVMLGVFLFVWWLLNKTRMGQNVRAVSQDREMASMLGINAERVYLFVMGLSAALAGLAGILVAPFLSVVPDMGWTPLITAFTIVVLGGLGNIWGTLLAAVIVSYAEIITAFAIDPQLREAVTFTILILVLIFKPAGLFTRGVKNE